jgi:hypothetical protein
LPVTIGTQFNSTHNKELKTMGCCSNHGDATGRTTGPFAEGRELVDFVYQAHGGSLRNKPLPGGGLATACQGCGVSFNLTTFVGKCPACGGVHAVSPPRSNEAANIQFAGTGYQLPEG